MFNLMVSLHLKNESAPKFGYFILIMQSHLDDDISSRLWNLSLNMDAHLIEIFIMVINSHLNDKFSWWIFILMIILFIMMIRFYLGCKISLWSRIFIPISSHYDKSSSQFWTFSLIMHFHLDDEFSYLWLLFLLIMNFHLHNEFSSNDAFCRSLYPWSKCHINLLEYLI